MPEAHFEPQLQRPAPLRGDLVSPALRADDPEMAAFLENLYARNLPEAEEALAIRHYVKVRQSRSAA